MIEKLAEGVRNKQMRSLAKAITLIESTRPEHLLQAGELLDRLLPYTGKAIRVGISGVPGAGKSTFIETFGLYLIAQGYRIAVLAVDPSSQISGGSILGDKTRMEYLAREQNAFVRPSPAGQTLGGVARKTRETMLLCEAAGYDIILVETVGVGQSEITVASMVDFFMLMQLANSGDELQGIKKGVMEVADAILVNKADGDNKAKANLAKQQLCNALHILRPRSKNWTVPVMTCSALKAEGIDEIWEMIESFRAIMKESGELENKRQRQALDWMWTLLMDDLKNLFIQDRRIEPMLETVEQAVISGQTTPGAASRRLLKKFRRY